jgi:hypothetical protein
MAAAAWILGLAVWAVYEAFALFAGRRTLSMQIWMARNAGRFWAGSSDS